MIGSNCAYSGLAFIDQVIRSRFLITETTCLCNLDLTSYLPDNEKISCVRSHTNETASAGDSDTGFSMVSDFMLDILICCLSKGIFSVLHVFSSDKNISYVSSDPVLIYHSAACTHCQPPPNSVERQDSNEKIHLVCNVYHICNQRGIQERILCPILFHEGRYGD